MTRYIANLKALVKRRGREIIFGSLVNGTYDPSKGKSVEKFKRYCVKAYTHEYDQSEVDGNNILAGDRKVLMMLTDTSGVTLPKPKNGDRFEGLGDNVSVVSVKEIMEGNGPVCYVCRVRE